MALESLGRIWGPGELEVELALQYLGRGRGKRVDYEAYLIKYALLPSQTHNSSLPDWAVLNDSSAVF